MNEEPKVFSASDLIQAVLGEYITAEPEKPTTNHVAPEPAGSELVNLLKENNEARVVQVSQAEDVPAEGRVFSEIIHDRIDFKGS